jgi:uncharacterized protein (TIGR01244 family)
MPNFKQVDQQTFIGSQPAQQDLKEAKALGIRTVIDLRLPEEGYTSNEEITRSNGLAYVNMPVNKTALSARHIDELERAMAGTPGPYLLHCATGARAVLILMLSQARQKKWTAEQTFTAALRIGFNLEDSDIFAGFVKRITV